MISLMFAIIGSAVGTVALGVWLMTRQRPVPLNPQSLVVEPPAEFWVKRLDETHYALCGDSPMPIAVYSGAHPTLIDRTHPLEIDVDDSGMIIFHAHSPQPHHYFELVHDTDERRILAERVLRLEGSVNLRDIGGYVTRSGQTVRWGQVYRSGTLISLTQNDWDYLKQLNIQAVCDFRSHDEVILEPDSLPAGIRYLHQPVATEDNSNTFQRIYTMLFTPHKISDMMQQMYTRIIIDQNPQLFRTAFAELSNASNAPILIHCTAGKDRTGITIALLLEVLGVPDEVIIADYTLSNLYYEAFAAYAQHALDKMRWFHVTADVLQPFLLADPRIIEQTLKHIRRKYGSVERYLHDKAGITPQTLEIIREKLLEPAQSRVYRE